MRKLIQIPGMITRYTDWLRTRWPPVRVVRLDKTGASPEWMREGRG